MHKVQSSQPIVLLKMTKFTFFIFIFLVPALIWDCSLCWDHFEGGTDAYTCLALPCGSRAGADLGQTFTS